MVNNTVNVPKQEAPIVNVDAILPPLDVTVSLPARKTSSETTITRDAKGNIVKSKSESKETDA